MKLELLGLVALLIGAGCATAYRPVKGGTGFSDSRVAADKFEVSFQGNGQTTSEQASDYALLRSAQVTLEHGFNYFAVLDITNTTAFNTPENVERKGAPSQKPNAPVCLA